MKKILLALLILLATFFFVSPGVLAEACSLPNSNDSSETLQRKIDECNKLIQMSAASTKPHEEKMKDLESQIAAIDANIKSLEAQIAAKKIQIADREKKLVAKQVVLETHIRDFYKKDYQSGLEYILTTLFSGENLGDTVRGLGYRQNLIDQEKRVITAIVLEITDLAADKKKLEETQSWVAVKKASLEATLAPIRDLVNRAKAYQSQLSSTVGSLTSRQQELIAARIGSLNLSRSAGISMACSDDRNIDPGFSPRFAFYTFGIPHRVGMSQFGAYGRAKNGQGYDPILHAYYNFDNLQKFDTNTKIKVQGYGEYSLEDYTQRIYEVPETWPMDALRAQAIAARSYALRYVSDRRDAGLSDEICTSQDCQVFKPDPKTGQWAQAVRDTEGLVMVQSGKPIKAWFSSTDGGYTWTSGEIWGADRAWTKHTRDTNGDIGSIGDLQAKAYDHDSPCFYNAQGWRSEYKKSAWLQSSEVADVVNVILVSPYTNDWDSWDFEKVKSKLRENKVTPFNSIDSVSMEFDLSYGKTTWVNLSGDVGSRRFDAKTFKDYFNVRAPANIAIVGPLYNIEKR